MGKISLITFANFYSLYETSKDSDHKSDRENQKSRSHLIEDWQNQNFQGLIVYAQGDVVLDHDVTTEWLDNQAQAAGHPKANGLFCDGHLTINGILWTEEEGGLFYFARGLTVDNIVQIEGLIHCPAPLVVRGTCLCAYPEGFIEGTTICANIIVVIDHHFAFEEKECNLAIGLSEGHFYRLPNDIVEEARNKASEIAGRTPDVDKAALEERAVELVLSRTLIPEALDDGEVHFSVIADFIRRGESFLAQDHPLQSLRSPGKSDEA